MQNISARDLAIWLADIARPAPQLLDVREPWEFETARLPNAQLVPMRDIPARLDEIETGRPVVCICRHGMRSQQVATFLQAKGFANLYNLAGGMHAWSLQVDPAVPTY